VYLKSVKAEGIAQVAGFKAAGWRKAQAARSEKILLNLSM
jgi:hypothetical protein